MKRIRHAQVPRSWKEVTKERLLTLLREAYGVDAQIGTRQVAYELGLDQATLEHGIRKRSRNLPKFGRDRADKYSIAINYLAEFMANHHWVPRLQRVRLDQIMKAWDPKGRQPRRVHLMDASYGDLEASFWEIVGADDHHDEQVPLHPLTKADRLAVLADRYGENARLGPKEVAYELSMLESAVMKAAWRESIPVFSGYGGTYGAALPDVAEFMQRHDELPRLDQTRLGELQRKWKPGVRFPKLHPAMESGWTSDKEIELNFAVRLGEDGTVLYHPLEPFKTSAERNKKKRKAQERTMRDTWRYSVLRCPSIAVDVADQGGGLLRNFSTWLTDSPPSTLRF